MNYTRSPRLNWKPALRAVVCVIGAIGCRGQEQKLDNCVISYVHVDVPAQSVLLMGCDQDIRNISGKDLRWAQEVAGRRPKMDQEAEQVDNVLRSGSRALCIDSRVGASVVPRDSQLSCIGIRSSRASVLLVGEGDHIKSLSSKDIQDIRSEIDRIVDAERFGILSKLELRGFRGTTVKRLNRLIGRQAIGDIFWESASVADYAL